MNSLPINYPVGVIGDYLRAKEYIQAQLSENDEVLILDIDADIEEIKQFRLFLLNRGLNRKVGIIYNLNKWSENEQAILLKIFEQLPEFNTVYYTATFFPNFVIKTRSHIVQLGANINLDLKKYMEYLQEAMRNKQLNQKMMDGWKILIQTESLFNDGIINLQQKATILRSLGID